MSRYQATFERLAATGEGAFVPFMMLSDPSPEAALEIIATAVEAGADAVELGVPFSDPVADGPSIQLSHVRALDGGATVAQALEQIRELRTRYPELPIGILTYSNVAFVRGLDEFYRDFHDAGADAVLLPDVPVRESEPFSHAAIANGIDPIYIAPHKAAEHTLRDVAANSRGYIYAVSRDGGTGDDNEATVEGLREVVESLEALGAAPVMLGFGISTPQHVADAVAAGAAGAITGSAINNIVTKYVEYTHPNPGRVTDWDGLKEELSAYVAMMKGATLKA